MKATYTLVISVDGLRGSGHDLEVVGTVLAQNGTQGIAKKGREITVERVTAAVVETVEIMAGGQE